MRPQYLSEGESQVVEVGKELRLEEAEQVGAGHDGIEGERAEGGRVQAEEAGEGGEGGLQWAGAAGDVQPAGRAQRGRVREQARQHGGEQRRRRNRTSAALLCTHETGQTVQTELGRARGASW